MNYFKGDLLNNIGIIVHGCNSLGAMGAGIAFQVKRRYPKAYQVYRDEYSDFGLKVGTNTYAEYSDRVIVNAVTQELIGRQSKVYVDYVGIESCFRNLRAYIESKYDVDEYPIVNIPKIGCGLGGGDWDVISNIIEKTLPCEMFNVVVWTT